jgi:hypothetical protein
MNNHPYLRAYMAGTLAPSIFLLVALAGFVISRLVFRVPIPIERVIVFPMALVPNLFGLWNVFYLWLRSRPYLPIGFHGALLPLIMAPLGGALAIWLGFLSIGAHGLTWFETVTAPYSLIGPIFAAGLVLYYLVWKYIVGFFNQVVGIG